MKYVKKILLWSVVAFCIYAVFTSPSQAASILQSAWDLIVKAFLSIGDFFNALLNKS